MTKKLLLLDTCIISRALTPNQTPAYASLFSELELEYRFAVSGYTRYELMRTSDKKHRAKINDYIAQDMTSIDLSPVLMDFTARLNYLYSKHSSTKGKSISTGDIVNAAVAIIKKCPIITMDNNDYPTPFFQEIGNRKRITYDTGKNKEHTDTLYFLQPDMENLEARFKQHDV